MGGLKDRESYVFGLDIGTRSVVGTVGYRSDDGFHVVAQEIIEHSSRAMLDGQIHDINKVGETVKRVKERLETRIKEKLTDVCIAAAGRVLKTITVSVSLDYESEKEITEEDIYNLSVSGIEQAYAEFQSVNDSDMKFYLVGYTPIRYYLNGYQIGNLEGHKARKAGADLIATFLPDDVVDGLYKAVEIAGLSVANLTLEPIAAIRVAIPEKFRLLNLALVDVGAGTSDISITRDGSVVAYGMIPTAGDSLTEIIVQKCLVDFDMAETIKKSIEEGHDTIEFTDIMGLPQKITTDEIYEALVPYIDDMTTKVADEIKRLNGDKSVSAVFVVGGGGKIKGYTEKLSEKLGIINERVAIRGEEVMKDIIFENEDAHKDSLMVTPVGIALSYYDRNNNFLIVTFNGERVKLYDNGHLTVSDAALMASFPNTDLFPKRGRAVTVTIDGNTKIFRGEEGEPCRISVNSEAADLYSAIKSGDVVEVIPSAPGNDASVRLGDMAELKKPMRITVNSRLLEIPRQALVNGKSCDQFYELIDGDVIKTVQYHTVSEIGRILDTPISGNIRVNNVPADLSTKVYEGFSVEYEITGDSEVSFEDTDIEGSVEEAVQEPEDNVKTGEPSDISSVKTGKEITVTANGKQFTLTGKESYVYVDVFDKLDFDLSNPQGRSIITLLNGKDAKYMENLKDGDVIEIRWEDRK